MTTRITETIPFLVALRSKKTNPSEYGEITACIRELEIAQQHLRCYDIIWQALCRIGARPGAESIAQDAVDQVMETLRNDQDRHQEPLEDGTA